MIALSMLARQQHLNEEDVLRRRDGFMGPGEGGEAGSDVKSRRWLKRNGRPARRRTRISPTRDTRRILPMEAANELIPTSSVGGQRGDAH
jgi:hypothetical protein